MTWRAAHGPWVTAGLAVLLGGCATAPAPPAAGLPPPSRAVLANGVRPIIQEHRAADVVAVQLWIGAGARDEAEDERGFSHLVEHMLFKDLLARILGGSRSARLTQALRERARLVSAIGAGYSALARGGLF